jgi:nucleoside-diphosphate-sugar epimerase
VTTLVCLGFGYAAQHYANLCGARFERIVGTTRTAAGAAALGERRFGGRAVEVTVFDAASSAPVAPPLASAIADASALLVSIAPEEGGDPALAPLRHALAAAPRLASIVYLSTIAVYGNHDGGWIDETTPLAPSLTRAADRIEAERAWIALGAERGIPVAVIRVAGIYGPSVSALDAVKAGRARRIVKPGQVFNRIHVADLAQIIDSAIARRAAGAFNAADDEPSPPGDPLAFAADLLGMPPPPEVAFEEAKPTMSPLALSFYGESKRVKNDRIKSVLGVALRYPTYREGLRALAAEMPGSPDRALAEIRELRRFHRDIGR